MRITEIIFEDGNILKPETEQYMASRGYRHLASGSSGDIWVKDDKSVTKIVQSGFGQSPLNSFVSYVLHNPNNPHLPKLFPINGKPVNEFSIGNHKYYEVALEKLQPLSLEAQTIVNAISSISSSGVRTPGPQWYESLRLKLKGLTKQLPQPLLDQLPSFLQTARGLYNAAKKGGIGWDMGTGNVMQRADGTLVINDPFGGGG